jgi:hypothetical protein
LATLPIISRATAYRGSLLPAKVRKRARPQRCARRALGVEKVFDETHHLPNLTFD